MLFVFKSVFTPHQITHSLPKTPLKPPPRPLIILHPVTLVKRRVVGHLLPVVELAFGDGVFVGFAGGLHCLFAISMLYFPKLMIQVPVFYSNFFNLLYGKS